MLGKYFLFFSASEKVNIKCQILNIIYYNNINIIIIYILLIYIIDIKYYMLKKFYLVYSAF